MTTSELAAKLRSYNEGSYSLMRSLGADHETITRALHERLIIQRTAGSNPLYSANPYRTP